jgi:hypothetical protein
MSVLECCKVVLQEFDINQKHPIEDERDIASMIRLCITENVRMSDDVLAELYAFSLQEDSRHGTKNWGTYYGPKVVYYEDESFSEEIPLEKITSAVVSYWEKRISECSNPVLVTRYSGLVWDLKNRVSGSKPDFKNVGLRYLENLLRSSEDGRFVRPSLVFKKLARGLSLSVSYNQPSLKNEAIERILNYEEKVGSMTIPGNWRYSYDLIVKGPGVNPDEATIAKVISRLQQRFNDLKERCQREKKDISHIWEFSDRLSEYYRSLYKYDEIKRILTDVSAIYEEVIKTSNFAHAIHILEKLHVRYKEHGFNEDAESILVRIQGLGPKMIEEMKLARVEFKISNEDIEKIVADCLIGDLKDVFENISIGFIPRRDIVLNFSGGSALFNAITKTIHDKTGRKVSEVGPVDEDEMGNIVYQMAQTLTLYSICLDAVLRAASNRSMVTFDAIMNLAKSTPLIRPDKYIIIGKGIDAYFQNELIAFMHIIVPQIEAICLRVIEVNKGNIWRESRSGSFNVRVFDDILRDDLFIRVVGEDISLYLRAIFTEQRGWNIRNIISHGLSSDETFTTQKADRVFVVFLYLCLLNPEAPLAAA